MYKMRIAHENQCYDLKNVDEFQRCVGYLLNRNIDFEVQRFESGYTIRIDSIVDDYETLVLRIVQLRRIMKEFNKDE